MRRTSSTVFANPTLVGAVTILVTLVAVFLAYNANNGLPFVPVREMSVVLPNAQNLLEQNEVREGGARIGIIDRIDPVRLPSGAVAVTVHMKLDRDVEPFPVDSRFRVRPRSALALKYLELTRGRSAQTVPIGGELELAGARSAVEIDDFLNTFDAPTRRGQQDNLQGFGDGFIGRGDALNEWLGVLPGFFTVLEPVARNLSAPGTRLERLFPELGDAARIIAPIADQYAEGFTDGATTFEALARDPDALRDTIARTPRTLRAGTRSFVVQQPFLTDFEGFSRDLEHAADLVVDAAPEVSAALEFSAPVQRRSVALNERLQDTLLALGRLVRDPATSPALTSLTALTETLNPTLRFVGPKITVCNGFNFFWTFNAEHLSEANPTGTAERGYAIAPPDDPNGLGRMGATEPVNGPESFFHGQPYGRAVDEQGNADCEAYQRGYLERFNPFGPADQKIVNDPRTPGTQGPAFDQIVDGRGVGLGPARVPRGQTFSAEAQTGMPLP